MSLQRAGVTADGAYFDKVELDKERGTAVYEVEFKKAGMEYDVDINAITGEVVKFEKEKD